MAGRRAAAGHGSPSSPTWSASTSASPGRCRGRCPAGSGSGWRSRALAAQPRILILDESVAALDVSIQAQVLNLLADIRDETGVSYILISHDLAVVRQLADTTIVLRRGQVVEHGPTGRVLDEPQHAYTRLLRDCVPRPGWKPARQLAQASAEQSTADKEAPRE